MSTNTVVNNRIPLPSVHPFPEKINSEIGHENSFGFSFMYFYESSCTVRKLQVYKPSNLFLLNDCFWSLWQLDKFCPVSQNFKTTTIPSAV